MAVELHLRFPSLTCRKSLLELTYRKDWTQLDVPGQGLSYAMNFSLAFNAGFSTRA